MSCAVARTAGLVCAAMVCAATVRSATLEKLTLEQMAQKSTLIVRGRVAGCSGETRGSVIYTRCVAAVSEVWKGSPSGSVSFLIPGGSSRGLTQNFTGTPRLATGGEYVLFLWAGQSGQHQIIGLSQGLFDLKSDGSGQPVVKRAAATEMMLDRKGVPVQDSALELTLSELRSKVTQALRPAAGRAIE